MIYVPTVVMTHDRWRARAYPVISLLKGTNDFDSSCLEFAMATIFLPARQDLGVDEKMQSQVSSGEASQG